MNDNIDCSQWDDAVDEELDDMEDVVEQSTCEALFREMAQLWLKENGLKFLLEEAQHSAKSKPKYRRQNASCFGQK